MHSLRHLHLCGRAPRNVSALLVVQQALACAVQAQQLEGLCVGGAWEAAEQLVAAVYLPAVPLTELQVTSGGRWSVCLVVNGGHAHHCRGIHESAKQQSSCVLHQELITKAKA